MTTLTDIFFQLFEVQGPFISPKIKKRFKVLKTTDLNSEFQCKNLFWKICTESWYIGNNVSSFQAKCQKRLTFLPISLDLMQIFQSDFLGRSVTFICRFFCHRVCLTQNLVHEKPLRNSGATYLRDVTDTVQTVQYSDSQCTVYSLTIVARALMLKLVACRAILYSTTSFYTVRILFFVETLGSSRLFWVPGDPKKAHLFWGEHGCLQNS